MNTKLLAVATPPPIYHGCSNWKTFWEEIFTGEKKFFPAVNTKNCGRCNVRKHREIKGSDLRERRSSQIGRASFS